MKTSILTLIPDCTDLNPEYSRRMASPAYRHCEERSNPTTGARHYEAQSNLTINNKTKKQSPLLTDCFSEGSEQAVPRNDGYSEIVALKQVPRNEEFARDHFP